MNPKARRAIINADHFEVRTEPDDPQPVKRERLRHAEEIWRASGGLIYAVNMTDGETLIGSL